jgi:hypothetical protein
VIDRHGDVAELLLRGGVAARHDPTDESGGLRMNLDRVTKPGVNDSRHRPQDFGPCHRLTTGAVRMPEGMVLVPL